VFCEGFKDVAGLPPEVVPVGGLDGFGGCGVSLDVVRSDRRAWNLVQDTATAHDF
jgi:hypothetical protein